MENMYEDGMPVYKYAWEFKAMMHDGDGCFSVSRASWEQCDNELHCQTGDDSMADWCRIPRWHDHRTQGR